MSSAVTRHGPREPEIPLVLDSPHSGREFPDDFGSILSEFDLRDGEDCYVDALYQPAVERLGLPFLTATFPRTYLDPNRHRGDVDLDLLAGRHWPFELVPSGKARVGKALVWRTLGDGRAIYDRLLTADEVVRRIERCHTPYHAALCAALDAAHARFGAVYHLNCHSMPAIGGAENGDAGAARADFVLGDRDGTTCAPAFTAFVRATLVALGYDTRVNDPFKGVELVRAYAHPPSRRHSLQIEINKRLYMDETTRLQHGGFAKLQKDLLHLVEAIADYVRAQTRRG